MGEPAPAEACSILESGKLVVANAFLPLLKQNRLDTFESIMALKGGVPVRSVPGRRTIRLELNGPSEPTAVYLKRYHRTLSPGVLFQKLLRLPGGRDEALREWEMAHVLRKHGVPTLIPIAAGASRDALFKQRSFVMTLEIAGGIPGHDYVKTLDSLGRRRFIERLADLTRRFHQQGFIHKDYYLQHIFVLREGSTVQFRVIDLQRVLGPASFRERWLLKDVAALGSSARRAGVPWKDLLRFYHLYHGKTRLGPADKRRIRKMLRRIDWTLNRTPKYGESPPV